MASPHIAADMLEVNGGAVSPSMFPQFDAPTLTTFLTRQLDAGVARASAFSASLSQSELDAASLNWAYYETFLAVWRRLSLSPASVKVDGEVERSMLAAQIQTFADLAAEYRQRYESILPAEDDATGGLTVVTGVPTRFRY